MNIHPIKAWRQANKLTQVQAASILGIAQPYLHQLETGKKKQVSVELAIKIEIATNGEINRRVLRPDFPWELAND